MKTKNQNESVLQRKLLKNKHIKYVDVKKMHVQERRWF